MPPTWEPTEWECMPGSQNLGLAGSQGPHVVPRGDWRILYGEGRVPTDPCTHPRHVMAELLDTERVYVDELLSVLEVS